MNFVTKYFWIICVLYVNTFHESNAVPVSGLELDVGFENFVYLSDGTDFSVTYVYTAGTSPTVTATLDTGTTLSATINTGNLNGNVNVQSSVLSTAALEFGTYLLTIDLSNSENNMTKEMVVFYEEPIEGFQVTTNNVYVPVNEEIQFDAVFTKGSNIELEWFLDGNDTCLIEYFGVLRSTFKNHTFVSEGTYNVTVIAANTISRTLASILVTVQNRVNGFSLSNDEGPIDTQTNVAFNILLNNTASLPMGNVFVNLTYGDGQEDTAVELNTLISSMTSVSVSQAVTHSYSTQGNYTIDVVIYNEIDSMTFSLSVYIWNNLAVYMTSTLVKAQVNEEITFDFSATPSTGFYYYIEYGDGTVKENTSSSILYEAYTVSAWTFNYTAAAVYVVKMSAWNPFYISNYEITITVQSPIPDLTLSPASDEIPLPDGIMTFTLEMTTSNPQPTNVTCFFDYGEFQEPNITTDIIYGSPVIKTYTYTAGGTNSVNFTCVNEVSSVTKTATVIIREFTLSDFVINYDLISGMNMTDTNTDPSQQPNPVVVPVTKIFQIGLFSVSRLPPDITFTWDFGDGTPVETEIITFFTKNHTYTTRGSFTIQLTINATLSLSLPIQLGVITLTSDKIKEQVGLAPFTFTASGVVGGTYDFSVYPGASAVYTAEPAMHSFTYNFWGVFFPYVTGSNGTFIETTYSDVVYSDYLFLGSMSSHTNDTVYYPPGNTRVIISISPGSQSLPNMTCKFDMDDFVGPRIDTMSQNITDADPLIFYFQYNSLGEHHAKFNCSNPLEEFTNETTVIVGNDCFKITGIFDRQYSTKQNPMKCSTSANIDLANRMPVLCPEDNPQYDWRFYKIDAEGNETVYNKYIPADVKGTLRCSRGELPEGLYKVYLNISLWGSEPTWISEFTYLKFSKAPPYVSIIGGNQKTAKIGITTVDALTDSYDPEGGYGVNANLNYTWYCQRFNTSDLLELETVFYENGMEQLKSATNLTSDCKDLLKITHGKADLNATSTDYKGYIIIVEACIDSITGTKCTSFTQMIQTLLGNPPTVQLDCQINCKEKFATTSKMNVRASCSDCEESEYSQLSYLWELKEVDNGTYKYFTDTELTDKSETGTRISSFVLKPNVLVPGKTYVLSVTMNAPTRVAAGKAMSTLKVNYPPYGGSCSPEPEIGNATTTPFQFKCTDWIDEGVRDVQNATIDVPANEPLNYEYISVTKKMLAGTLEEVALPLYYGSESTATEQLLSVGDQKFEYNVTIVIKIIDYFGDHTEYNLTIKVKPDLSMIPTSDTDTAAIDAMMSTFDNTYNQIAAGGNVMAAVQCIATTASVYTSSLVPTSNVTTYSSDDVLTLALTNGLDLDNVVFDEPESPITQEYKRVTERLTDLLLGTIPDVNAVNQTALAPADVTSIVKSMQATVSNPDYINDNAVNNVADASVMLMDNLMSTVTTKPFPVESISSINEAIGGMISMLESTLEAIIPDNLLDQNAEISEESVTTEYDDFITYNNINLDGYTEAEKLDLKTKIVAKLKERKEREKTDQKRKIDLARTNVPKMLSAILKAQTALSAIREIGQQEKVISKNNMEISVQLGAFDTFLESNVTRQAMEIAFDNNTANPNIQLWLAYFKKPVHIYGEGASKITSPEMKVEAKTLDNADVQTPLTLKVTNEGVIQFKPYTPVMQPDDPDEMYYFKYEITDEHDATLIYVKPDELNYKTPAELAQAFANADYDLYVTYARDDEKPRITANDFEHTMTVRDWSEYGFKVFMNEGFKSGTAHIALKPLKGEKSTNTVSRKKRSVLGRDRHGPYLDYDPYRIKHPVEETDTKESYFSYYPQFRRRLLNTTVDPNSTTPATVAPISSFQPAGVNFSVIIATTGCRTWNDATSTWDTNNCNVLPLSTLNETICRCPNPPYGSVFATTFYVPPNTIDFSTVWSKFDASNAAVYATCIGLIAIYFLALIWARREDKKDLERWATLFLCDSDESDEYFYVITVHTGLRRGAGTKSNVNFVVAGDEEDSGVRILSDGVRKGFETSSVRKFFMGTSRPLGDLTYLRIWHDSSGQGGYKSWYLHKIFIDDPQANRRYVFQCDSWLALEQGDGMVERLLPVCGRENLVTFEKLFSGHARFNLTESHIWLSLIMRPEKSTFSRVQRLSCILALLFLTMIASAMFFRSSEDDVTPNQVQIGFIRFSLTTIYISFISILITTPPILLVTMIFKKAKPAVKKKQKKLKDKMRKNMQEIFKQEDAKTKLKETLTFSEDFYKDTTHPLPHWTVYIAWFIVFSGVVVSAFFLILYSMQWGKPKAEEWLFSFFFSFIESLIVVDPAKVIMIAVLFALIFKKPMDEYAQDVNLKKVRDAAKQYNNGSARNYLNLRMDVLSKNEPPPASELDKMRKQRKKELEAHQVFFELLLYLLYVFVLYSISYVNRDQRSYTMKTNIYDNLITSTKTQFGFSKVSSSTNFFKWMNETLFPQYFPLTDFDEVTSLDVRSKLFFGDLANVRIGPARLRQVRMKKEDCRYPQVTSPERDGACIGSYSSFDEDEAQYCFNWSPFNSTSCPYSNNPSLYFTADAWKYTDSSDIWGVPITGEFNTYGGGGYILKFETDLAKSQLIVNELKDKMWIDRGTRAVFMEFTFYNANANLFAYCIFLTEFTELGGLITWNYIQTFRPYQTTGALGTYVMVCYFIFLLVLLVSTIKMFRKIKETGCCTFIKTFWNAVDFICMILSYIAIVMWVMRFIYSQRAMSRYYDDKTAFINFQHVVIWDFAFNIILGIMVFVGTIRILRCLGYNKRMTQLADVLKIAGPAITGFLFILGIVFFAYVSLGFLLFGAYIYDYRSLFISFGSLANTLIGKNSLDSMISAAPAFAQFYYFTYVFCVILTLMTMFAAILNQSIAKVRLEVNQAEDPYGILDILKGTIRDVLGIAFTFNDTKDGKKGGKAKNRFQPKPGTNPDIDTPNILRLVRETFGELGDAVEYPDDQDPDKAVKEKLKQIEIEYGNEGWRQQTPRAYTPGDVDIMMNDFENKTNNVYNAYL